MLQAIYKDMKKGKKMAKYKNIDIEWQDKLDQLKSYQKHNLLIFMLRELKMWSTNDDVIKIIRGHTAMLLEMMNYNIDKAIHINKEGEEQ